MPFDKTGGATTTMPSYKYQDAAGHVLWFCSFYYKDFTGKRKKKKKQGFSTKRAADEWERDFLQKKTGSPSMTVKQLSENYFEDVKHRLKASSVCNKKSTVAAQILPTFGDMPLDEITPAAIRQWENTLISRGLKDGYISYVRACFSSLLNYAHRFYSLANNPVRDAGSIKGTAGREEEKKLHYWTREQFAQFITSEIAPEYIVLFSILFWTGCRLGEACALTVADIDIDGAFMSINKTVYYTPPKRLTATTPKTAASVRKVSLPVPLVEILRDWMKQTDAHEGQQMLFRLGISKRALSYFTERTKKAGLPTITVHDLRHSHASMLVHLGFSPMVIRDRLGHKDIQTTLNIYSHLYPTKMDDVARRLSDIF